MQIKKENKTGVGRRVSGMGRYIKSTYKTYENVKPLQGSMLQNTCYMLSTHAHTLESIKARKGLPSRSLESSWL